MSSGSVKRTRSQRVATLKLPPGLIERAWETLQRWDVLARIALCLITALAVWVVTGGWVPPFAYRVGDVPRRTIITRVSFERINQRVNIDARNTARRNVPAVYRNDPRPLRELQVALKDHVFRLLGAPTFDEVDKQLWREFNPPDETQPLQEAIDSIVNIASALGVQSVLPGIEAPVPHLDTGKWKQRAEFASFKQAFADDEDLSQFTKAINRTFAELEDHGLLESLMPELGRGSNSSLRVYRRGEPNYFRTYEASEVRISEVLPEIRKDLRRELPSAAIGDHVFAWIKSRLPTTLTYDEDATIAYQNKSVRADQSETIPYEANVSELATAGQPLTAETVNTLREEHRAFVEQLGLRRLLYFSLSKFGMYAAVYTLCGFYIFFRYRSLLNNVSSLAKLLLTVFVTVAACWFSAPSRGELIPLLLFSMTAVILYHQELALLLSACVALVTVLSLGFGVVELVTVLASMSTAVLLLQHVRSRTKLIYVGLWTAVATSLTAIGVGTLVGEAPAGHLMINALFLAGCCVAAGLVMTGLLPFIERFFDVQTDLSLLELGDVAHPLLQELVRRAPGTYNHSINVASIAQAAAESIGANGLLVRVGAYFHDIGKMLKPGYFVENQGGQGNCHESLMPAMSTLVIIAHVKDGANLAIQHNLPNSILDFIEQHHGTTLVEYFYRRANEQREADPEAGNVDEGSFRYPGPKPQTREAAVLMLSDAVESAARTLVDPAPARIESLVEDIAMKRLMDGQFDECGITLKELRTIQDSLIKSLTAVYHGRIKYPSQQTA